MVTLICPFEFKILIYGNEDLLYEDNCRIFDAVQGYLELPYDLANARSCHGSPWIFCVIVPKTMLRSPS